MTALDFRSTLWCSVNFLDPRIFKVRDLEVLFDRWHISASSILGFPISNCCICNDIRSLKYLFALSVHSRLECASIVWAPSYQIWIKGLEQFQRKFLKVLAYKWFWSIVSANAIEIWVFDYKAKGTISVVFLWHWLFRDVGSTELPCSAFVSVSIVYHLLFKAMGLAKYVVLFVT